MIGGLILAAGAGTRFGERSKLLAELDGRPLLAHAIAAQCAVDALERVVVVLGAAAPEILERVDFMRAEPVVCSRWSEGQALSLRCGIEALSDGAKTLRDRAKTLSDGARTLRDRAKTLSDGAKIDRVIVTLGDQPRLTPELIARFVGEPPGTRATYQGRPGHPVVLGPVQMRAIAGLHGDQGARELLRGGARIELGSLSAALDVDTPEDLEAIRHEARAVV